MNGLWATQPQLDYVRNLQRRLHLTNALLDAHCVARFGAAFVALDRAQCSALIDEMKDWESLPVELQREAGQADLPGFGTA